MRTRLCFQQGRKDTECSQRLHRVTRCPVFVINARIMAASFIHVALSIVVLLDIAIDVRSPDNTA